MRRKFITLGALIGAVSLLGAVGITDTAHAKKDGKGSKHAYRDGRDSRPPGWSRGRKTGWGGSSVPPGQRRNQYRDRYEDDRNGDGRYRDRRDYDRDNDGIDDRYERRRQRLDERYRDRDDERFRDRDNDGVDDRYERRRDRLDDRYRDRRDDRYRDRRDDRNTNRGSISGRVTAGTNRYSRSITVEGRRISVGQDVPVYRDGRRISIHDIREGEYVRVRMDGNSSRGRVTRIDVS